MSHPGISKSMVAGGLVLVQVVGHAAPYPLAASPRGAAFKQPAPNVIVSVDNSGSMKYSSRASDGDKEPTDGTTPSRLEALKAALRTNFSPARVADGQIRLAWQSMNDNRADSCVGFFGESAAARYRAGACRIDGRSNANLMRSLDAGHRRNFMRWVDNLGADGGTPLHAMMTRAGEYMKTTGTLSPFSDEPGVENAAQSSCRKSFHIFMTDGDYNLFGFDADPARLDMPAVGNADGTARMLPDGQSYVPRAPFRDDVGALHDAANWTKQDGKWTPTAEYRPTLADVAFHYWASDLQPGLPNTLEKTIVEAGDAKVGQASVAEYWNPRNDPATWQHLSTYTIGFGAASEWVGSPAIAADAPQPTYSGDYSKLVEGSLAWRDPLTPSLGPNKGFRGWSAGAETGSVGYWHQLDSNAAAVRMDLWHAALNSRGSFTPAANAEALTQAFDTIVKRILDETRTTSTSIAAGAARVSAGGVAYQAGYDTPEWSGRLTATPIGSDGRPAATPGWSASERLDARLAPSETSAGDRQILSFSRGQGVPFRWDELDPDQQAALQGRADSDAESVARGQAVLRFLRGDRSNERSAAAPALPFRARRHVLGDIVNSVLWHAGPPRSGFTRDGYAAFAAIARTPMVYVGANDGMLHAFDAGTGEEAFAYVPAGLYGTAAAPGLKRLSEPGYTHRYYVDGSPFVADIDMGADGEKPDANAWKSLLVGTLGAGGKGYFVLDVTRPEEIRESGAAATVLIDATALADDDLGHQFQAPVRGAASRRALQVASLNNGRRALILGNGYNSRSEKAALWIQYLDGDRSVLKIFAPATQEAGAGNGLSAPYPVDRNNDGRIDFAYAGDLRGNLWRFDLSGSDSRQWKATLGLAQEPSALDHKPLFSAGAAQPITAAPLVADHPSGGYMVMVGTGRLFAAGDERTTAGQALYGIWDRANGSAGTATTEDLVAQTIDAATFGESGVEYRTASKHPVSYQGPGGKRGWRLTLPAGERIIHPGDALTASAGLFSSTIPGTESDPLSCTPGDEDNGFSMVIDFFSGAAPDRIVYNALSATTGALGYRNGPGRDDLVSPGREPGQFEFRNPDGEVRTATPPQFVRRFGWRNLISSH